MSTGGCVIEPEEMLEEQPVASSAGSKMPRWEHTLPEEHHDGDGDVSGVPGT